MRIFASWSGERSRRLAHCLKQWLPHVIQTAEVWVSSEDIGKGKRWSDEVAQGLDECHFGIVCVTPENIGSEWVHFEAGALAKSVPGSLERGRVTPILLDLNTGQISGPLSHFQATSLTKEDMGRLVHDINSAGGDGLDKQLLAETFDVWWPMLADQLGELSEQPPETSSADSPDLLAEVLNSVRSQERSLLRLEREFRIARDQEDSYLAARARSRTRLRDRELLGEADSGQGGPAFLVDELGALLGPLRADSRIVSSPDSLRVDLPAPADALPNPEDLARLADRHGIRLTIRTNDNHQVIFDGREGIA